MRRVVYLCDKVCFLDCHFPSCLASIRSPLFPRTLAVHARNIIKPLIHKRRDNAAQTLNGPKVILYFHNIFFSTTIKATIASIMAFNSVFSVATERL